jgi:hypothetical protein
VSAVLPAGFEDLQPYAEGWAVAGTAGRIRRRLESTAAERLAFFNAAKERVAEALALLDGKPLAQLDAAERILMDLLLGFAHVALAVEIQGEAEAEQAQARRHMKLIQSSADRG